MGRWVDGQVAGWAGGWMTDGGTGSPLGSDRLSPPDGPFSYSQCFSHLLLDLTSVRKCLSS